MSNETPSIADEIRELIAEDQRSDEVETALKKVTQLEHDHAGGLEKSELERAFLQRAPREGLLYPGDALKLDDVPGRLRELGGDEQGLKQVYRDLRATRPYLFAKPAGSLANQKFSQGGATQPLRHGSLTRQVQELRRKRRS